MYVFTHIHTEAKKKKAVLKGRFMLWVIFSVPTFYQKSY
jgi:hypothetical protein